MSNAIIAELKAELLRAEIEDELLRVTHFGKTHGTPSTYTAGCRGPICKFANTERMRKLSGHKRNMDPSLAEIIETYILMHHAFRRYVPENASEFKVSA